jgi:hypothetical protein
MTSMTSR